MKAIENTSKDPIRTIPSSALDIICRIYCVCDALLGMFERAVLVLESLKAMSSIFSPCQTRESGSCHSDSTCSQKFDSGGTCHILPSQYESHNQLIKGSESDETLTPDTFCE